MGDSLSRARRLAACLVLAALCAAAGCGKAGPGVSGPNNRFAGPTRMTMTQNFLDPYGPYLFIANNQGGTISVINARQYSVLSAHTNDENDLDVIRVGHAPFDIALTPEGARLFVTDAWFDHVRIVTGWPGRRPDVFNAYVFLDDAGQAFLRYDIEIKELPFMVRAGELAVRAAPREDGGPVPVYVTDPDNQRVVVLDSETGEQAEEIILPEQPERIAVSRLGERVYVTTSGANLLFIDGESDSLIPGQTIFLGGDPGRMIPAKDGDELYILNADPPAIQIIDLPEPPRLLKNGVPLPAPPNGLAAVNDGYHVYISGDDGFIYVFDAHTRRICNSWGGRVFFTDKWPASDPGLENIQVKDCVARTEQWELVYHILDDEWTVRGSMSGLQSGRAKSNQFFLADAGDVGFFIRENDLHSSDGDTFYFETNVGIAPIRVGLVPDDIAVIPYYLNPLDDVVFVANSGTHNLSILFTEDYQHLGVIN